MTLPPPPPSQPSEPTGSQPSRLPPPPPGAPSSSQGPRSSSGRTPPPPVAGSYGGPPPGKKRANLAIGYGIFGLIPACGAILAILAVVMGLSSQKASRNAGLEPFVTAKVGVVLGGIGIAITLVMIIITAVNAGR